MRGFTVGFSCALGILLWTSSNFVAGLVLLTVIGVGLSPFLPRFFRLLLLGACVGGLVAQGSMSSQLNQQLSTSDSGQDFSLIGTVASVPKQSDRAASFLFRIERYIDQKPQAAPQQIRLSWYGPGRNEVRAGDQWQLVARLKPPASLGNPGGFNFERWLFQHRIHATGYVRDAPKPQRLKSRAYQLHAVRQSLAETIESLPAANEYTSLVQGLTVGVTNNISVEQWQTLRLSGTAHLLAISGLHIGLISAWFYLGASLLWKTLSVVSVRSTQLRCTKPVFALSASCFSACCYAALAGFSLPTQRALIMLGVFALSTLMRRVWPPGTALMLALLLVLLIDPLAVLSVGFWLSFGTVAALFYLHNGRLTARGKIAGAGLLHLKLGVVLLPATAWFFQQGAMLAPIANAIAVPVVGLLVVPASFLIACLASSWPWLANVILVAVQWLLAHLMSFLNWLLAFQVSSLPLFLPSPTLLVCVLTGLLLLFAPRALRLRWMAAPLLAPAIVMNMIGKPVNGLELHVLDVGQGLSAVLFTPNHTVVFDTGKRLGSATTMVDRVLHPFLISQGRSSVDVSIISHADSDHAGGLKSLLRLYPETKLYSSDEAHVVEHRALKCVAGDTFVFDNVTFSFLHPGALDTGSRNNNSCVLLAHYGHTRVVLAGDIESESEKLLIARVGQAFPVTALVAPHHGSRSSSTTEFVQLLNPEYVIYAAGERNAFQFPHDDIVQRYEAAGAVGYTTGVHGAVSLRFDLSGLSSPVDHYWRGRRRYRR